MPLIALDLVRPSPKLRGTLSRRYLEMRSGLFVGSATVRMIDDLWELVLTENPLCATLAYGARNELGVAFRQHGACATRIIDSDGLSLVFRANVRIMKVVQANNNTDVIL